ncbi:MAG TPA: transposase [Verrucomicrobiae bacterium]|jgi:transposase|nr:transposase [Verrucomicrobiae bacterium]
MEEALKERKKGGTPKKYDEQFRRSVVEHWAQSDKTAATVAKEFGVNIWNLRDWKRRYEPPLKPVMDRNPIRPRGCGWRTRPCASNWRE